MSRLIWEWIFLFIALSRGGYLFTAYNLVYKYNAQNQLKHILTETLWKKKMMCCDPVIGHLFTSVVINDEPKVESGR